MGLFSRKKKISLRQLAEGVVWASHEQNFTNRVNLSLLQDSFNPDNEEKRTRLEFEYSSCCLSLWSFRYYSQLQKKNRDMAENFSEMVIENLNFYIRDNCAPEAIEAIKFLYGARIESYKGA
ncbi:MAG: hypothetical protein U5K27_12530 [Desulfotignum sp.]|nr:hypothetical protein [Desulfotignum sp.]